MICFNFSQFLTEYILSIGEEKYRDLWFYVSFAKKIAMLYVFITELYITFWLIYNLLYMYVWQVSLHNSIFFFATSSWSFTTIVPKHFLPSIVMTFLTALALVFDTAMCTPNLYWGQD